MHSQIVFVVVVIVLIVLLVVAVVVRIKKYLKWFYVKGTFKYVEQNTNFNVNESDISIV